MNFNQDLCAREKIERILPNVFKHTSNVFVDSVDRNEKYNFRFYCFDNELSFQHMKMLAKMFQTEDIVIDIGYDSDVNICIRNATIPSENIFRTDSYKLELPKEFRKL